MIPTAVARNQRGFALIVVLWTVGILALLVSTLVAVARVDTKLSSNRRGEAIARAAADAVLSEAVIEILRSGAVIAGPRRFGAVRTEVRLENLSGRINPNIASATMLRALLLRVGVLPGPAESLAAAIVDWRTPGLSPSPHGAKAADYRAARLNYGPPGRPFESLAELGYVLGMTQPILTAIRPHMTLWSTTDPVPAYADAVVLGALRLAGAPPAASAGTEAQVIAMTATATMPDAPRVTRRAVVRFGYSPDGRGWRVLSWDDGEASSL
jgi:general secretion pathway protein K